MTDQGMSVRRAALIVVVGAVATTFGIPIVEFIVWPSLVAPGDIEQTVRNIRANEGLFLFASFAYLTGFVGDLLVAWALYYLLRPVSQSLAALAAGLRAVQAVIAIGAVLNLFTAFRLLQTDSLAALGLDHLYAHVLVLLSSFGYEWASPWSSSASICACSDTWCIGPVTSPGWLALRSPSRASATSSTTSSRISIRTPRSASSSPRSSANSSLWSG